MKLVKKATPAAISVLKQATALKPKRKKASDGLLPSAAHIKQSPTSDHNTGYGVDVTHDPVNGIDCAVAFEKLKADRRVKYLIFNGKIWSPERGGEGNRDYSGANKHNHHLHISIKETAGNDTSPWFPWLGESTKVGKIISKIKPLPKKEVK